MIIPSVCVETTGTLMTSLHLNDAGVELAQGFPDLALLHADNSQRYPFLLESVAQGSTEARYDILFAFPQASLVLNDNGELSSSELKLSGNDFLDNLDRCWKNNNVKQKLELPFQGGWFIYLGYELAEQIEPVLQLPVSDNENVTAYAVRIPAAVIRDHVTQRCWVVSEDPSAEHLQTMHKDIADINKNTKVPNAPLIQQIKEQAEQEYLDAVEKIRGYIIEGDVFQVNLSRQWSVKLSESISDYQIYESLRQNNPSPFAGIANYTGKTIISSSPERLVSVHQNCIETRPIAGTRPRGSELDADQALSTELLAHPKERAEHIMLIDLERNDLGRVCTAGSIEVNELMVLESYTHVHHIVSNVRGRLRKDVTPGEVIKAVFPGGTITGCPKIRCMEIIAELEKAPRGAYTGSMGYLNHNGDMDLNILIRTMTRKGDELTLRAGAGIVADSIAVNELQETRSKAKGLLNALGAGESL